MAMTIRDISAKLEDMLLEFQAQVREELEAERADHDQSRWILRRRQRDQEELTKIKGLVAAAERAHMTDEQAMALIRGILHS